MSVVVLQEGDNFTIWKGTKWHCTYGFIRQIIVIAYPNVMRFGSLKGPTSESVG